MDLKLRKLDLESTLRCYGLEWVVVTADTEELVAAFVDEAHAISFLETEQGNSRC